jgi:N-acetylmuramoyl-L-alanine amidase
MRISGTISCLVILVCVMPCFLRAQSQQRLEVVVIDAGHGGKDPGAIGKQVQEKTITLAIALKLGALIQSEMKDVRVIYTRDKDEFIELYERADIANRNKADLFISVHCNATRNRAMHGAETYIMGLHRSEANLETAKKENASILMETDHSSRYQGFDPNSDESYIIFTLYQDSNLDLSTQLAAEVQEQMKDRVELDDHGVRQAGFLVLYKTTMPSLLVEAGYLSNTQEETFLMSQKGQEYVAEAIFRALKKYRSETEKTAPAQASGTVRNESVPPGDKHTGTPAPVPPPDKPLEKPAASEVSFRVQVYTSPTDIGINAARFRGLEDVQVYKHQGIYKYTTGDEKTPEAAFSLLSEVRKKGFKDAFVVAFSNGTRISVEKARALIAR